MVRHVIVWKLKEDVDKKTIKNGIKEGLEGLMGIIPGLLSACVHTEGLPSSKGDLMLDMLFDNEEALNAYTIHPEHVKVATTKVRPFVEVRLSFDYEVSCQE